jgi:hypothetical protein
MLNNIDSEFRGAYHQDDQLILQIDINVMISLVNPMDSDRTNFQV